jgi:hypothetical protein
MSWFALEALARASYASTYVPGEVIASAGDLDDGILYVTEGLTALSVLTFAYGLVPIAVLGPGRFLNLDAISHPARSSFTASAIMSTTVLHLPTRMVRAALKSDLAVTARALRKAVLDLQERLTIVRDMIATGKRPWVSALERCPALVPAQLLIWKDPDHPYFKGLCRRGCAFEEGWPACPLAGLPGHKPYDIKGSPSRGNVDYRNV